MGKVHSSVADLGKIGEDEIHGEVRWGLQSRKRVTDPGEDTQTLMKVEIRPERALNRHLVNFHYNEFPTIHSSRRRYVNLL